VSIIISLVAFFLVLKANVLNSKLGNAGMIIMPLPKVHVESDNA